MPWTGSFKLNLFSSWVNHAVGLVIGVVLMPYVLHTLGDEQYGLWIFISSFAGYSGLMYLGFGETISRFVATTYASRDWPRLNQVVSAIWLIYLLMGAVAIAGGLLVAAFAPGMYDWGTVPAYEIQAVILIMALNIAIALVGSVYGGVLMGIQRFDVERSIVMIAGIVRLIVTYIFLQASWGLLTMSLINLAITFIENGASYIAAHKLVPTLAVKLRLARLHILKECSSFSFYAFVDTISAQVIDATDSVVIGLYLGAEAIVPFYIAQRICHFIARPIQYIGLVSIPRAGELHVGSEARHLHRLVFKGAGLAFLLTTSCLVGSAYFGDALIATWIGDGYTQSYLILMILLSSRVVALTVGVMRSVLFGIGQMKVASLIYLAEAVANITLSLVLIQSLGILGVAIGTAVPVLVIEFGILLPYALKKIGIAPSQFFTEGIVPQLVHVLALWVYCIAFTTWFPHIHGWFALIAVTAGAALVFGATLLGTHFLSRRDVPLTTVGT